MTGYDLDAADFDRWALHHVCVHCLGRQREAVVVWVSAGIAPCTWCGRRSEPMSKTDYVLAVVLTAETKLERWAIANGRPWPPAGASVRPSGTDGRW